MLKKNQDGRYNDMTEAPPTYNVRCITFTQIGQSFNCTIMATIFTFQLNCVQSNFNKGLF